MPKDLSFIETLTRLLQNKTNAISRLELECNALRRAIELMNET